MVDDRLVVIDHGRACDAFKGNRFDRGDVTLCLKAPLKTGKKHGGKGRSSKRMKAKCEGKRNPLRIDGSQFSPTDVKKKGIGPQIRIEPFAEPAEVLQDAIEGMTSWNSPTLPEAGKLARFQRRKPQKMFQRPLLSFNALSLTSTPPGFSFQSAPATPLPQIFQCRKPSAPLEFRGRRRFSGHVLTSSSSEPRGQVAQTSSLHPWREIEITDR